jgi:hypothetical protein
LKNFLLIGGLILLSGCAQGPHFSDLQGLSPYVAPPMGDKSALVSSTFEPGTVLAGKWAGIAAIDGRRLSQTEDKAEDVVVSEGVHKAILICHAGGSHALVVVDWAAEPDHHYALRCERDMMSFPPGGVISIFDSTANATVVKGEGSLRPDEIIIPIPVGR